MKNLRGKTLSLTMKHINSFINNAVTKPNLEFKI